MNRDPRAHIRYGALPRSRRRFCAISSFDADQKLATGGHGAAHGRGRRRASEARQDAGAEALLRKGGWIKACRSERGRELAQGEAEELKAFGSGRSSSTGRR